MFETYMDYVTGEKFFTYGSSDPAKIKKLRKRIAERPDGVVVVMDDLEHGMMVRLPTSEWNFEAKPKARRAPLSEEAKEKAIAGLRKAKEARGLPSEG